MCNRFYHMIYILVFKEFPRPQVVFFKLPRPHQVSVGVGFETSNLDPSTTLDRGSDVGMRGRRMSLADHDRVWRIRDPVRTVIDHVRFWNHEGGWIVFVE
ncbi:hypothetical protein M413DRAFT_446411 [Hebeloma cylindrosporum]|uniref:Uncharacterized protein n=1 Tax=Hebeloma cylindrosporum TaxID=76867 RepID=A0A0C2XRI5_HEBCY|nr:hypothetical protein M413DRAFT_446411 [Hebeloma cylindrosporum h7]